MRKNVLRKVIPLFAVLFLLCSSFMFSSDVDTVLTDKIDALKKADPYSTAYALLASDLFDYINSNKSGSQEQRQVAATLLNGATSRVLFSLEDTIKNLGDESNVSSLNSQYVSKTLSGIDEIHSLPAFKNLSLRNQNMYSIFLQRVNDINSGTTYQRLLLVENSIADLSDQSTKESVELVYKSLLSLGKEIRLLSKENLQKLFSYLEKYDISTKDYPLRIIPEDERNLSALKKDSSLQLLKLNDKSPTPSVLQLLSEKKYVGNVILTPVNLLFTDYTHIESIRLTIDNMGGAIHPVALTRTATPNSVVIDSYGRFYQDLDENPDTISFEPAQLGDFHIIELIDFYPYSTNFSSRMEWKYQNANVASLARHISNPSTSYDIPFCGYGVTSLPYYVFDALSKANRTVYFTDADVSLYPKAFESIKKEPYLPIEYVYACARSTQDNPDYKLENAPLIPMPDLIDLVDVSSSSPPTIYNMLALAGVAVAAAAIAFVVKKHKG